jgi:hypothetical protein
MVACVSQHLPSSGLDHDYRRDSHASRAAQKATNISAMGQGEKSI